MVVKAVVLEKKTAARTLWVFLLGRERVQAVQRVPEQGVSPPLRWVFAIKIEAAGAYG